MLSRVAESLYWIGRYVERAEDIARLININSSQVLDAPLTHRDQWMHLVEITGNQSLFESLNKKRDERAVVRFMLNDRRHPGSMLSSLAAARENARTIRDVLPQGGWEQLNILTASVTTNISDGLTKKKRFGFLQTTIRDCQTLSGIFDGTMSHDSAYHFLRIGVSIERADMTSRIIDILSAEPDSDHEIDSTDTSVRWLSLLRTLSAYQMYRREVQAAVERGPAMAFLLQDRAFPRSVMHCLEKMDESLAELPRSQVALKASRQLRKFVAGMRAETLSQEALHLFIDDLQRELLALHELISQTFFHFEMETPA